MTELTEYEGEVIVEFIEMNLVEAIKSDGIDSLQYLHALLGVWRKCGGAYDGDTNKPWELVFHGDTTSDFECPDCHYRFVVGNDDIGRRHYCPHCGKRRDDDGET